MEKRLRWFDEGASRLRLVLDRQGIGDQLPSTASPASGAVSPPGIRSSPREDGRKAGDALFVASA